MSRINAQLVEPQNRVIRGLIVDDEPVIHASIALIFEDIEWVSAMTAAEGLAHAGDTTFDVALVDKNLPDGSGISVARHLKEQDPHLSVVIVTGYPSMDSAIEAVRVGAFDYLPKPFQMAEAELKIRNAIEHSHLQRQQQSLLGALTESEELHRGLIEASPDAIFMLDAASNTILSANAAAAKLYGYTQAELVGLAATKLNQSACGIADDAVGTRDDCKLDGSAITVDVSRALANMNGRDVIIEIVRDLTERKRREQEEQRSSRMKMLGQLSGGVVHDLNNLLMVQAHCVDVFEEYFGEVPQTEETKEILEDVEALRTVTTNTSRLGRQLMTFAGQNRHGHAEGLNLNDVIEKMQRVLSRSLGEHIAIEITAAPDLRSVFADPGQIEQVILNLAVNARDAMAPGGTLHITTRNAQSSTGDDEVELEVRDTGTGIEPDVLPMIFEPLFSTKGPELGTGLGLATVQRIIHNAGGRLDVSSTVGLGTSVVARIPVGDQPCATGEQRDEATTPLVGRGELILVVEDDDGVRRAVQKMLVRSGFAVVGAHDGARALELLRTTEQEVALTLADVLMPVMSGGHLQERLRTLYSDPKIILMSGQDLSKSEDVFLQKPFTEQGLARVVRNALDDDGSANDRRL